MAYQKSNLTKLQQFLLHKDDNEAVTMEKWAAGATVELQAPDGLEVLVLEGGFSEGEESFEKYSWLRLPRGASVTAKVGTEGAKVWVKRGHLARQPKAPNP